MIEALNRGMEAGAWAFGALLIFGLGVLLVVLGIAGLGWAFGDGAPCHHSTGLPAPSH